MNDLRAAALHYSRQGWPVLPLHAPVDGVCDCAKACKTPGKHPRTEHGLIDASTDPDTIGGWWDQWPNANIGLVAGEHFFSIDVDGPQGEASLADLIAEHGEMPHTLEETTGRGRQFLLRAFCEIRPKVGFRPGIDVRGRGSYLLVPPSLHINGKKYAWTNGHGTTPGADAIAEAPAWLQAMLRSKPKPGSKPAEPKPFTGTVKPYVRAAVKSECRAVREAAPNSRHDTLN